MGELPKKKLYVVIAVAVAAVIVAAVVAGIVRAGKRTPRPDRYVELRNRINRYSDSLRCTLGVAVVFEEGDTLTVGNGEMYPMMSIVKLPLALASCRNLEAEGRQLSDLCTLSRRNWVGMLWSPLRKGRRSTGVFSVQRLLEFMISYSDNDVCQYFFEHFCSKEETEDFIRSIGIEEGMRIPYDYREIGDNQDRWNDVATTPYATAQVLEYLFANRESPEVNPVWDAMMQCRTGRRRVPAGIPDKGAAIAHKTGTSGNGRNGKLRSISDAAVVVLPDGRHFSIAVYVKDASFGRKTAERVIARVTRLVYDGYIAQTPDVGNRQITGPED